jgi:capsular polysaccharide biosynthesis protein
MADGQHPGSVTSTLTLREVLTDPEGRDQVSAYAVLRREEVLRSSPPVGRPAVDFFPSLTEVKSPAAFVACVRECELWADELNSALIGPGGALLRDVSPGYEAGVGDDWTRGMPRIEPECFAGALAPVTLRPWWATSYYHWMFEALPRLHLLQESGWVLDAFALHEATEPFHHESLDALGIGGDRLLRLESPVRIKADTLLVTPVLPTRAPQWVCAFLRDAFLPANPGHGRERIYVSREGARRGRRVENETEVVRALEERGFVAVGLEGMSVRSQAELFANAQCVISPHGGALTNLVFCTAGTTVIELFAPTYLHPLYWMISNRRGLKYHYFVGSGQTAPVWDEWSTTGGLDSVSIDLAGLLAFMSEIGIEA